MKAFLLLTSLVLMSGSAVASSFGEGYNNRLQESREVEVVKAYETVYVNSPSELPAGRWQCEKVSTYQGGPKGSWRAYYVCTRLNKRRH